MLREPVHIIKAFLSRNFVGSFLCTSDLRKGHHAIVLNCYICIIYLYSFITRYADLNIIYYFLLVIFIRFIFYYENTFAPLMYFTISFYAMYRI